MFGEAVEILKEVYGIAMLIKEHVETVQANKKQCQRLNERIQIVVSAAKGLEQLKDTEHYLKGLRSLKDCLQRCVNFVNKFTASSKWYRYLLKTNSYSEEFQELTELLEKSANLLQLGLNAQQIFNREKDKEDQKQDVSEIQNNQAKIIELNQEEMKLLQKLDMNQQAQQQVLQQQFESLKEQLNRLTFSPNLNSPKPLIDSKLVIPFHQLLIDKQLAQGSFGAIYQGRWENSDVAIKMLVGHLTPDEQSRFVREVDIMSRLRHPKIAALYGACLEKGRACLVMPYYENQDLQRYLKSKRLLPEQQKQLALDIAKGLQYLHNQNVLHRSLQSSNVLIDKQGKAYLSDFGLSKIASQSIKTIEVKHQELYWQAPEFFERNSNFTEASDVFSYGVVLWEILTGQHPKEGYQKEDGPEFIQALTLGTRLPIPKNLPPIFQALLQACWWPEFKQRPTLAQIIEQVESYQPRPPSPSPETYYKRGLKYEGEENLAEAFKNYECASKKGYFKAHTNYATFFLQGLSGVKQDKPKAAELFEQAAKQGHVRAMMNLAMMKEYGDDIPRDISGALKWYKEAANLGDKKALEKVKKLAQQSQEPNYQGNLVSMQFQ